MNLNKFLRKNSRTLLMVFMSFLLVAFLVPTQIQGCGERARMEAITLGEVFGDKITSDDIRQYTGHMRVINQFSLPGPPDGNPLTYYLLIEEARRAGVQVGREEVKQRLVQMGLRDEHLIAVKQNARMSYNEIYDVLGEWLAVLRLLEMQYGGVVNSVPREKLDYRNETQRANTRMVILDAHDLIDQIPDPSNEELEAFFAECKDRFTDHTESELVFGYREPDRVRIEYLTIDPEDVLRKIRVKRTQVKQYFDENRDRYTKPDTEQPPAPGQQPAQVPMTFEEAEDLVREDYRSVKALEVAQSRINEMYDTARRPWNVAEEGEDGFLDLPEGAEHISFEDLAERFSDSYPVRYEKTGLVDREEARRLTGFGQAALRIGNQPTSATEIAFRVEGILESAEERSALALMEPADVVFTPGGQPYTASYQPYLFRVVEVTPSAPLESLEPIREQVIEDWKLVQAFELARAKAEALASEARNVGLDPAAAEADELRALLSSAAEDEFAADPLEVFSPYRLTRASRSVPPRVGDTTTVPEAVFELVDEGAASERETHPVTIAPQAREARWIVVELLGVEPVYEAEFEQIYQRNRQQKLRQAGTEFTREWLAGENVQARTGYTELRTVEQ